MERLNQEGVPRDRLVWALRRADMVRQARARQMCLLCGQGKVNLAGLCELCYVTLQAEELALAERLMAGASV